MLNGHGTKSVASWRCFLRDNVILSVSSGFLPRFGRSGWGHNLGSCCNIMDLASGRLKDIFEHEDLI